MDWPSRCRHPTSKVTGNGVTSTSTPPPAKRRLTIKLGRGPVGNALSVSRRRPPSRTSEKKRGSSENLNNIEFHDSPPPSPEEAGKDDDDDEWAVSALASLPCDALLAFRSLVSRGHCVWHGHVPLCLSHHVRHVLGTADPASAEIQWAALQKSSSSGAPPAIVTFPLVTFHTDAGGVGARDEAALEYDVYCAAVSEAVECEEAGPPWRRVAAAWWTDVVAASGGKVSRRGCEEKRWKDFCRKLGGLDHPPPVGVVMQWLCNLGAAAAEDRALEGRSQSPSRSGIPWQGLLDDTDGDHDCADVSCRMAWHYHLAFPKFRIGSDLIAGRKEMLTRLRRTYNSELPREVLEGVAVTSEDGRKFRLHQSGLSTGFHMRDLLACGLVETYAVPGGREFVRLCGQRK